MQKNRFYSLRFKIMALFSVLVFFLFIIISLVFYKGIDVTIRKATEKEYRIITDETANKMERFLYERYGDIQVLANNSILHSSNILDSDKIRYLDKVRSAYKTYDYILVFDKNAKLLFHSGNYPKNFDYTNIFYLTKKHKVYVSDIDSLKHSNGIFFSSAIYDERGDFFGIVLERMNLNSIRDIKTKVKVAKNGYAFLMNEHYHYIFINDISDRFIINTKGDSGIQYINYRGNEFIYIYKQLKRYPTQTENWYLVLKCYEKEAFSILYQIWYYTLTVIVISILTVILLGYLVSYFITLPIQRLVKETELLAKGELFQKIQFESKDEIGSLASSLNTIIMNLNMMMDQILETSGQVASVREIKDYFNRLTDEVSTGIITVNASGNILSINLAGNEILSIKDKEIVGLNLYQKNSHSYDNLLDLIKHCLVDNRVFAKEIINIYDENNKNKTLLVSTSFQKDKSGRVLGLICIFREMDEFIRFEESISRAKTLNALGMMSAGIAHEIRNPLTSIKGYAQYVKAGLNLNDELQNDLNIIIQEVDRLNKLINRFLDFARPKAPVLKKCNISRLINNTIKLLKMNNPSNFDIHTCFADDLELMIDEDQIEQVLLNVLLNAIQSLDNDAIILVNTFFENDECIICIEDNGKGIESEDIEHLFEPFFTKKDKGTGLGLAISARIIQEHAGSIEYKPAKSKGSVFIIKLPLNV